MKQHAAGQGSPPDLLKPDSLGPLLRRHGFLEEGEHYQAHALGGGVSNIVLRVETPGQTLVIKQSLPQLRVEMPWYADRDRIWRERGYLEFVARLLPANVPTVLFAEPELYVLAMTAVPDDATLWKQALLAGECDLAVVERAARLLARIHSETWQSPRVAEQFGGGRHFEQLRVDPYLRTIARRHTDLAEVIHEIIAHLLAHPSALVHGDYSPKNMFVKPDGDLVILDAEVAHWGDPTFDVAFCLNHLLLKAVYHRPHSAPFLDAATHFWRCYQAAVEPTTIARSVESRLGGQLAGLFLARVDGKSPVEYLLNDQERISLVRQVSRTLLPRYPNLTLEDVLTALSARL